MSDETHIHLARKKWETLKLFNTHVCIICIKSDNLMGNLVFALLKTQIVNNEHDVNRNMIETFFFFWFRFVCHQDGATSHAAKITMELLPDLFPQKVISRNCGADWLSQ